MGILEDIKASVAKSGQSRDGIFGVKGGDKKRVRFLNDISDGQKIVFHDKWEARNAPCGKMFGDKCALHNAEGYRTRDQYAWTIWNYEEKKIQIFLFNAGRVSPVPALVQMHETYGTLRDRDYVISRTGTALDTVYTVVPMDKKKFKLDKKALKKKKLFEMIQNAFDSASDPIEDDEDEDDDSDEWGEDEDIEEDDYDDEDDDEEDDD